MPPMGHPPPPLPHQSNIYVTKKFIFGCSHCICTIFILTSYTLYTQVKPILILINVQYLQNVAFGLEKGLNGQNHFSGFHHHVNWKFPIFSGGGLPLSLSGKPCSEACRDMHWVMVLVQSTQHICFFKFSFWYVDKSWYRLLPPLVASCLPHLLHQVSTPMGGSAPPTTKIFMGNPMI